MSAFWNFVTKMVSGTLAKAEDVNTNLSGIDTGFGLVETELNKSIQVANSPGTTDIALNAAARANKLLAFDVNGDIAASQILGDWKGDHADAAGTDYEIRDVAKDAAGSIGQDNIYICTVTHTSTGDLATDIANWDLVLDAAAAAASAAAALASENAAAATYDLFDDRMLGAFNNAGEPTLDNDGDALVTGAMYFNTTINRWKVYNGVAWQIISAAAVDVTISDAGSIYTAVDVEAALQEVKLLADAATTELGFITVTQAVNLDTIESDTNTNNAKLTANTANVTSAGALMDSEVDADIKTLSLPANTTISAFGRTLIDDAAASNARTTLGLGALSILSSVNASQIDANSINASEMNTNAVSPSTHINDNITTSGNQNIGASAAWTPGAGFYNVVLASFNQPDGGRLELYIATAWAGITATQAVAGACMFDGTNMRIQNQEAATSTVSWQRFNG